MWMDVALAAIAGGCAVLVARAFIKNPKSRKTAHRAVLGLCFLLFWMLGQKFIMPRVNGYTLADNFEDKLRQSPAFSALQQHEPSTYRQLVNDLRQAVGAGQTEAQVLALSRDRIAGLIQARIGKASDDTAIRFVQVAQDQSRQLHTAGPGLCFQYLFPKPGEPPIPAQHLDRRMIKREQAVMGDIIKDSAERPAVEPLQEQVTPALMLVAQALAQKYTQEELQMLDNPHGPGVDKEKVCSMNIDFYDQVLQLPTQQKGPLLRFLLKA